MSALGFDPSFYNECADIWNKIGRPNYRGDIDRVVTYVAMCKYRDSLKSLVLSEPEHIMIKGTTKRNPNYDLLEDAERIIRNLDKELRLSYWPKGV